MTRADLHNAVRSRFKTEVADAESLATAYDNVSFEPPENTEWARWTVIPGETRQITIGGTTNHYRTVGLAVAQIFTPLGQGDKRALELARVVEVAFRSVTQSGVRFQSPSVAVVGRVEGEYQVNVSCPFHADDVA